ncbi:MAG: hypothetical protein EXR69_12570 [Myxococcales bacterium]|nr:hypothetical protein [Myxococcales bacterium]
MARPVARRLAFVGLTLLLFLGGAEVALRVAGVPKRDSTREFTHNEIYWVQPPNQHLEPVTHKESGGAFRVSTDSNGLRAPLHSQEKTEGTFRVMTLGCSTTFGWGVNDEETYPYLLEQNLKAAGHNVEVINGGQPGYSSFQGLWLWQKTLAAYKPDLVIFGYIVQDSRAVAYSDSSQAVLQANKDFLKANLLYRLHSYVVVKNFVNEYRMEAKDKPGEGGMYRVSPEEYVGDIRAFKANAEAVGAKLVLFGYPLEREGYTGTHRRILHAAAEKLSVPVYDPQPEFEQYSAQETLYFPQDRGHANPAGNAKIAQGVTQFLVSQRLVE